MFKYILICLLTMLLLPQTAFAAHGVSLDGTLKYPAGFTHFDYTSLKAREGGRLVLHSLGSFDKMNPFTLKGTAPAGLNTLVFEPLAVSSLDEPFAKYGLIAQDIKTAADGLSVTFTLNPLARFSDGSPLTAADVKFSLDTLKSPAAHPFYQSYFRDISEARILGPHKIKFIFKKANRELHLIACELPILSRAFYQHHPFNAVGLVPPVGSGPYIIKKFEAGKYITYEKNPAYWGKNLPVRRGMFNFQTITYKYFKDQQVSMEAFKAGDFDFMTINIAKQWQRDLKGPRFRSGQIIKKYLPHKNDAGMQGFVMNIRRPLFADRRVREALGLAFDFEWTNKSLFFGQYTRCDSYFSNSELAARGLPKGRELALLKPFKKQLPPEVFTTPLTPFTTSPPHSLRGNLRRAQRLLKEAGWQVVNNQLVNRRTGRKFIFEILLASPAFERVIAPYVLNLKRLGITAGYRTIDPALYTRRLEKFNFDMVVGVFGQSQSPGNEQRDYWSSAAADREGSRNLIGIKSKVVDALVNDIIYSHNRRQLKAACHALDRVLWYGYYVVPNWYLARHRVAYWNKFDQPKTLPLYYQPLQALMTWWRK
ncbi:ABC transporter, substrate-binding protein (cluster 5, nickel/peptides/opines) [hydrothermal vent metagenome]|uniref:ABC transporter, substrate-binding protein (Cluster 5, nickel/peptides/opines) n=1 Tax=hydrothermal vent metagenome TaxID=652676 RepID=A0A3B0W1A1_9ZZZZ